MNIRSVLTVLILSMVLMQGCVRRPANQEEIRVGVVQYRSFGVNGSQVLHAVRMAVDTLNARGGLKVAGRMHRIALAEILIDEPSEEQAVAGVQQLINQENVVAIVGPQISEEAIAAGELAERGHIPMICPIAADGKVTDGRKFVFRMGYRDDFEGKALAELAAHTLNARTAAIFFQETVAYSRMQAQVFRKEFTALGGRIVAEETFVTSADISPAQLQRIRRAHPDVVLLPNYADYVRTVGEKLRGAGVGAVFLGPDCWSRKNLRSVPAFEGSFMTTNWSRDLNTLKNRAFIKEYTERFHEEPSETAALTYDAFSLLFAAIQLEGKFDPSSIQRGLYALPVFTGVGGDIDFTESGDPKKGLIVLQFKSGRDTFYTTLYPEGQ